MIETIFAGVASVRLPIRLPILDRLPSTVMLAVAVAAPTHVARAGDEVSTGVGGAFVGAAREPSSISARFPGTRTNWQGFDRFDFECDARPCFVIAPATPAAGRPWLWRARFPEKPAGDRELLEHGFHVVFIDTVGMFANAASLGHWDSFYGLLTEKHGLSRKPALLGISRGGLNIHAWAAANPDKVSCLVGVAPVCDIRSWPGGQGLSGGHGGSWRQLLAAHGMTEEQALAFRRNPVDLLEPIAKARIPVLHIYSPQDEGVPYEENTKVVAERLAALGGDFTGRAFEYPRSDAPEVRELQARIDLNNPRAVARAHSLVCNDAWQAEAAAFILEAAGIR